MKVNLILIFILITIFPIIINSEFELNGNSSINVNNTQIIISTYLNDSFINISSSIKYGNDSQISCNNILSKSFDYFYIRYDELECEDSENNTITDYYIPITFSNLSKIEFRVVNITKMPLDNEILVSASSLVHKEENEEEYEEEEEREEEEEEEKEEEREEEKVEEKEEEKEEEKYIDEKDKKEEEKKYKFQKRKKNISGILIVDFIENKLKTSITDPELFKEENKCFNNTLGNEENRKLICKLDYILFGHKDLKKDDVYLAKEIKEDKPYGYLDNLLNFSIFPENYLQYFLTSFFSELNDECQKNEIKPKDFDNYLYYITCPKKKIDIYTKRRKLSLIINKFAYEVYDLFQDSLDFLEDVEKDDNYYFNIIFEKGRTNFTLGKSFMTQKKFGIKGNYTYIYSNLSQNYTDYLTDINSAQFEKWLYILTTGSFTLLLLIFSVLGFLHSRKVNKELKEMLK